MMSASRRTGPREVLGRGDEEGEGVYEREAKHDGCEEQRENTEEDGHGKGEGGDAA